MPRYQPYNSNSEAKHIKRIQSWVKPSHKVNQGAQHELAMLFQSQRLNAEGKLPCSEFESHMLKLGLTKGQFYAWLAETSVKPGEDLDLRDFITFYRNLWPQDEL